MIKLNQYIKDYPNFPKSGIIFKDILPILREPSIFNELIDEMASWYLFNDCEALIAVDARGFIFGSVIASKLCKPLVLAGKKGKLPGIVIEESYALEYGENTLCIQKDSIKNLDKFIIIDDLLATGGTISSINNILVSAKKKIIGLSVVVELNDLNGRQNFDFPVNSQITY